MIHWIEKAQNRAIEILRLIYFTHVMRCFILMQLLTILDKDIQFEQTSKCYIVELLGGYLV